MSSSFVPGSALGFEIFSHREDWSASICRDAATWECGARLDFREDYCSAGVPRCFHRQAFAEDGDPSVTINARQAGPFLEVHPEALHGQVLFLWNKVAVEPFGVSNVRRQWVMAGLYRIQKAILQQETYDRRLKLVPYAEDWALMRPLRLDSPRYAELSDTFLRQVEAPLVHRLLAEAKQRLSSVDSAQFSSDQRRRLERALSEAPKWLVEAKQVGGPLARAFTSGTRPSAPSENINRPFADLKLAIATTQPKPQPQLAAPKILVDGEQALVPVGVPATAALTTMPKAAAFLSDLNIVESKARAMIEERYGRETVTSLVMASLTKPLVILRGGPGVGKSHIATHLLDDADRVHVVSVSSTWRGRDDLLGYVNPVTNAFEPTDFTTFLRSAAIAWDAGDLRTRVVVFEEFNLSPPEHWLSEIIVRSQYETASRDARSIPLGGATVRGWNDDPTRVFLAPSVRFVATINSDHTTRSLSPRILDRSSVVDIDLAPHEAAKLAGLALPADQLEAIAALHFDLKDIGATFTLRTAHSLKECLAQSALLRLDAWAILDRVIVQEVLSKVRLFFGDPTARGLCTSLLKWSDEHGDSLPQCARLIGRWDEALKQGRDVQ